MKYNKKHEELKKEAVVAIIEALECYDGYYCDLHNEVFNMEYYSHNIAFAKQVLNEYDVFEAIKLVQDYEEINFGEINTELGNPMKLMNMVWYIIGEEVIGEIHNNIEAFAEHYDDYADEEINESIVVELKEMIYN